MPKRYDVIIAGGGPAGATAAFFLGQAGKKVLVLEKEFLPRYKPCGGAVSARVLEQFPFSFEPVIQSRVSAISYALGDEGVTIAFGLDRTEIGAGTIWVSGSWQPMGTTFPQHPGRRVGQRGGGRSRSGRGVEW